MTIRHLVTLATVTLAASASAARAQVVFSQNFSGGSTDPQTFVGTGANQFDGILSGGPDFAWTVSGGALQGTRTNTAGGSSGAANRVTPLSGLAGGAATFQFDFNLLAVTAAANGTNDVVLQVGNGYTNSTGAGSGTYAQFTIDLQTGNQYAIAGTTFTGAHTLYFDLNNSGATVNFTTPSGGALALANDNFALFVDGTNVTPLGQQGVSLTGGSATADITQFKLRFANDFGTISADNFLVTVVPEPSTVALAGLGLAGFTLGAARRSRRTPATFRV